MINATSSIQSGGGTPAVTTDNPTQALTQNDFLKLLITQLQNQDPLNPTDQNQFLAQTAQFTQVSQLQAINSALADLKTTIGASDLAQAASLIGKSATASGRQVTFNGIDPVNLPFTLTAPSAQATINVVDASGNAVRQLTTSALDAGARAVSWDGRDNSGNQLTAGSYFFSVSAPGANGMSVAAAAQGNVAGFARDGSQLLYQVGDALVRPEDLTQVG